MQQKITGPVSAWLDNLTRRLAREEVDAYVYGLNRNMTEALIVFKNGVSICTVGTENGYGRWECSVSHLHAFAPLYLDRFCVNASDVPAIEEAFS